MDAARTSPCTHARRRYTGGPVSPWVHHVAIIYKIALVIMFFVVLFNLGQALYYMTTDKGKSKRTTWALTRRIGLSLVLIFLVIIFIALGLIHPHGISQGG